MSRNASRSEMGAGVRVVVVGPCASGKTTLVERLRDAGIDAQVSGQEHSAIRDLWRRLDPDVLIALDVDLAALRNRRTPTWPAALHAVQRARLAGAFAAANARIDTSHITPDEVLAAALAAIERRDVIGVDA